MSWYKSPITPYDPIIKDPSASPPEGGIRYFRDNFEGDGQDSNTTPPAQNQQLWQQLTNIQPITQGVLSRRWGYNFFNFLNYFDPPSPFTRMYSLQNNNTLSRQLVYSAPLAVYGSGESASLITSSLYSVLNTSAPARMVDSRNYAYFYTGNQVDLKKWDGVVNGAVTNWGIAAPSLSTISTSAGPFYGGSESVTGSGATWTNPNNVLSNVGSATALCNNTHLGTQSIDIIGLGFAIPSNATITGIVVTLNGTVNAGLTAPSISYSGTMLKTAIPYGTVHRAPVTNTSPATTFNPGVTTDLWGGNWTPGDINNSSFGVRVSAALSAPSSAAANFFLSAVQIKVYYTSSSSAVSVAIGGAGNVNLTVGRIYYCIFQNSTSGHFSDLNQTSASTGPVVNSVVNLSALPVATDSQVDNKVILATADGGDPSILYFLGSVPNATTTFVDNTPEVTLNLNQQYLFTDPFGNEFGVTFNDPPPNGSICIKHKGRLWMAQQQNLFFSKSVSELTLPNGFISGKYEECWNPSNYFDISGGAETISALHSDGNVIYIGTQNHIRRIFGDSPANFQQPEIVHQNVGVLNQETLVDVFLEGTPTGFMWLTPDFKVMGSDGNTYLDLGHHIQDVLSSINPLAAQSSHAMFVQQGPYDLFILAVPTGSNTYCDTHCVFNMRSQSWLIWKPTDPSTAMLFNVSASGAPQWFFAANPNSTTNIIYQYSSSATQDRALSVTPVNFIASGTTSWLHLGSPTTRKVLDEIEMVGDSSMQFSLFGASTQGDFNSPVVVVDDTGLVLSPFGTYKVYLAGRTSKYHYYQLDFESSNGSNQTLLQSYALRAVPWNTI